MCARPQDNRQLAPLQYAVAADRQHVWKDALTSSNYDP